MLIILKSFLLLNSSARSIINWCLLVLYLGEKKGAKFLALPCGHKLLCKNHISFISCVYIAITIWITQNLWLIIVIINVVVGCFLLGIVKIRGILSHKIKIYQHWCHVLWRSNKQNWKSQRQIPDFFLLSSVSLW